MDAIYAGTARMLATKFGTLPKVTFSRTDLNKLIKYLDENDSEFVSLNIKEKKEKPEGKPTHYLQVDEWKPNANKEKNEWVPVVAEKKILDNYEDSTLPF